MTANARYASAMRRATARPAPLLFAALAAPLLSTLSGCGVWFFSGETWRDRSRPVALVETTGGVELGATTEFGVLTLGRTATDGPCRVHYFLGPTPLIETGAIAPTGSLFARASIDLKTQHARALDRSPTVDDSLQVMWTPDGLDVRRVSVELARGDGLAGDLLRDPGVELPAGATLLCRGPDGVPLFAGLVAGRATVDGGANAGRYYVVAGVDRVRELLAVPTKHPVDYVPEYRADDISVMRPVEAESGAGRGQTDPPEDRPR